MNRVEFDVLPPEPERLLWCDWLRAHGIDPKDVALPGWIERSDRNFQITFSTYARDERGRIQLNAERTEALRSTRTVQLGEPPLPFPEPGGGDQ